MLKIIPIPAFQDNYIWLLQQGNHAIVVDPGDAGPVIHYLKAHSLELDAILITHHHNDHIDGVAELYEMYQCAIYESPHPVYNFKSNHVKEGDILRFEHFELNLRVIATPGHTPNHIVYYGANSLFCGDTLFSAGCGRLDEKSAGKMYESLSKIAKLPPSTKVYCTHEYTQKNIGFALTVESNNVNLQEYSTKVKLKRSIGEPTLPSTIEQELLVNPFLRCHSTSIKKQLSMESASDELVFYELRKLRNNY